MEQFLKGPLQSWPHRSNSYTLKVKIIQNTQQVSESKLISLLLLTAAPEASAPVSTRHTFYKEIKQTLSGEKINLSTL